jgi:hypothetical protein
MRHLLILALFISVPAFAKERKVEIEASESSLHEAKPFALGVADTTNLTGGQSASVMFATQKDWIHTFLGVNHSQGSFAFGAGAIYKFTVQGTRAAGFHIGPGVSVGTVSFSGSSVRVAGNTLSVEGGTKFGFAIVGDVGAHYTLFDHLIFSMDAGPIFSVVDGSFNFMLKPIGEVLGLSFHYLF